MLKSIYHTDKERKADDTKEIFVSNEIIKKARGGNRSEKESNEQNTRGGLYGGRKHEIVTPHTLASWKNIVYNDTYYLEMDQTLQGSGQLCEQEFLPYQDGKTYRVEVSII